MRNSFHPRHIQSQPTFRAPAHKHAHHLHSIPPREKSTRTLILDHLLWVHARTRCAQARAELGMSDPSGGPSSSSYPHRRRPETYDEDEHPLSDGEDLLHLKSRRRWLTYPDDDRIHHQDLVLAQTLRLRAEGLESVIISMLDQPPPHHPVETDIDIDPPTGSPKHLTATHPHALPNGVRLRLALGTLINDLFARQPPPQPYRHTHPPKEPHTHPSSHHSDLPEALIPLIPLSGASAPSSLYYSTPPSYPTPSSSTASLYASGADPSTANSPPSLRCPRHLHTGCPICVEPKSVSRPHHRHIPSSPWKSPPFNGNLSGWQDGTGIGSGLLRPGIRGNALRRRVYDDANDKRNLPPGGNTKLSRLLPRFLKLSALVAVELGQEARDNVEEEEGENWQRAFNSHSRTPTRLSSNSSKGKQKDEEQNKDVVLLNNALRPTREWYMLLAGLLTRAVLEGYLSAGWRGTRPVECLLLVGIQGHNGRLPGARTRGTTTGERGVEGQGRVDDNDDEDGGEAAGGDEEEFKELDPDGLPNLGQALRVLFPSLRSNDPSSMRSSLPTSMTKLGQAEAEYELEMYNRLRHFYDIPESTPDLSTHLEDLAWSYPAEPVERAAVRFCEAVARWRGKPELETYKKKPDESQSFARQFQQQQYAGMGGRLPQQQQPQQPSLQQHQQRQAQQQRQQQQQQLGTISSPSLSSSSSTSTSSPIHPLHPSYYPFLHHQQQQQSIVGGERRRQVYNRPLIDIYFSSSSMGYTAALPMTTTTTTTNTIANMGMMAGMSNYVGVRMGGGVKRSRGEDGGEDGGGGGGGGKRFHRG